ncbi:MAG: hypothetical protein K2H85_02005 [Allobaculum sp.]|nr:hypothetical protein [Allobaculum sp.]
MKLEQGQILMLQRHVNKHLLMLSQKMEMYKNLERKLHEDIKALHKYVSLYTYESANIRELIRLINIVWFCQGGENARFSQIRDIDNGSAIVAGNLALLIEHCIEDYQQDLKNWIVDRIEELIDLKESVPTSDFMNFYFPAASAILSPYIIKTQIPHNRSGFASLRNSIRDLIN